MNYAQRILKTLDGLDVGLHWQGIAIAAIRVLAFGLLLIAQSIDRQSS